MGILQNGNQVYTQSSQNEEVIISEADEKGVEYM